MFRKAAALTAVLCTTIAVAACGGSSPTSKQTASKSSRKSPGLELAECMRSHGIGDFPDPSSSGGGGTQIQQSAGSGGSNITVDGVDINASAPAFQSAMNACQKDQPQGPALSASKLASIKAGALKMAECMRSSGVPDFPDPKVSAGPGGRGIQVEIGSPASGSDGSKGISQASPAFQHAMKKCQSYMSLGGPRSLRTNG